MIVYRKARHDDLNNIAKVHVECFPDYMISKLGNRLVANYYKEFLEEDNLFVIAEEENEIIGFCMGYIKGSHAREKFVANNRTQLIKRLLWLCCRLDKLAISKGFSYLKGKLCKKKNPIDKSQVKKKISKQGDLLSICIKKYKRGGTIGVNLVNELKFFYGKKE